jgi:hypothetical protein
LEFFWTCFVRVGLTWGQPGELEDADSGEWRGKVGFVRHFDRSRVIVIQFRYVGDYGKDAFLRVAQDMGCCCSTSTLLVVRSG